MILFLLILSVLIVSGGFLFALKVGLVFLGLLIGIPLLLILFILLIILFKKR
jgi:hypothetical protein